MRHVLLFAFCFLLFAFSVFSSFRFSSFFSPLRFRSFQVIARQE